MAEKQNVELGQPADDVSIETVPLKLGDVKEEQPTSRTSCGGFTRMSVEATRLMGEIGRQHGAEGYYAWVAVREGKNTDAFYLVPTTEKDSDRLPLRWSVDKQNVFLSLRKVLKLKKVVVPVRHALIMSCALAKTDQGLALELNPAAGSVVPVAKKKTDTKPGAEVASSRMPPEAAPGETS